MWFIRVFPKFAVLAIDANVSKATLKRAAYYIADQMETHQVCMRACVFMGVPFTGYI